MKNVIKNIALFIFEIGKLKTLPRSGWRNIGVDNPVSVAGHQFRAAQIGYILACMEGDVNPEKVCSIMVVHDNGESRIGDLDKIASMYMDKTEAEKQVFFDQLEWLPNIVKEKWGEYYNIFEEENSKEAKIARDSDILEMAFQAKQYSDISYPIGAWIERVERKLQTESAKKILKEMKEMNFSEWSQSVYKKVLD